MTLSAALWYTVYLFDKMARLCYNITDFSTREGDSLAAPNVNALDEIKRNLEANVGKRIHLRANRGRRKVVEADGVLEKTYPKVFVVRLDKSSAVKRMSYSYADVLTETVELTFEDEQIGAVGS